MQDFCGVFTPQSTQSVKTYQPKILLLLYCMGSYSSSPKSAHISNYLIYTKCNVIWCCFHKTLVFSFQELIKYSWVLSSITTTESDQPNPLFHIIHFMVTLSALSTRKARPKCNRQQSCLCGSTLILAQEPECDLRNPVFFITLNVTINILSHRYTHNVTMLSQVNSS